jgi:hypothetical protein
MLRKYLVAIMCCPPLLGVAPATEAACATQDEITALLGSRYGESAVSIGLTRTGQVLQIFSSDNGTSWTLLRTSPEGSTCIVAAGKHWQDLSPRRSPGQPSQQSEF